MANTKTKDSELGEVEADETQDDLGGDDLGSRLAEAESALLGNQQELAQKDDQILSLTYQIEELEKRLAGASKSGVSTTAEPVEYQERVVIQSFGYRRRDLVDTNKIVESRTAKPGETVYLLPDQVERFEGLGVVGTQEQFEAAESKKVLLDVSEIAQLGDAALLAYLSQHSDNLDELEKIEQAERSRSLPTGTEADQDRDDLQRQTILESIETTRAIALKALGGAENVEL